MMQISQSIQKVLEVIEINLELLESFPPQLRVTVIGTVPSAGWTNPQLMPYTYVQAPPDGIYDFDFVAIPPKDSTAQVITPIRLRTELSTQGVNGIRVYASLNAKEALVNAADSPCTGTQPVC